MAFGGVIYDVTCNCIQSFLLQCLKCQSYLFFWRNNEIISEILPSRSYFYVKTFLFIAIIIRIIEVHIIYSYWIRREKNLTKEVMNFIVKFMIMPKFTLTCDFVEFLFICNWIYLLSSKLPLILISCYFYQYFTAAIPKLVTHFYQQNKIFICFHWFNFIEYYLNTRFIWTLLLQFVQVYLFRVSSILFQLIV